MLKISSAMHIRWPLPLGSGCGPDPPATFVASMFRMKSVHALLQEERRYSGGAETSVSRRI